MDIVKAWRAFGNAPRVVLGCSNSIPDLRVNLKPAAARNEDPSSTSVLFVRTCPNSAARYALLLSGSAFRPMSETHKIANALVEVFIEDFSDYDDLVAVLRPRV